MRVYDVLVIGASQAGLALGYFLQKNKQDFLILGQEKRIGEVWANRYDSLKLFTSKEYSQLPGLEIPGDPEEYPTKDEIAQYLETYAQHFDLPVQLETKVESLTQEGDRFKVTTSQGALFSKQVVVASGPFHQPIIPSFHSNLSSEIVQLHSSQYKNETRIKAGEILIVGGGNSGAQIAVELAEQGYKVYFSVSKKLRYAPLSLFDKSIFWWLDRLGILYAHTDSLRGKWLRRKGDPIFGTDLQGLIKDEKIVLKPRTVSAREDSLEFLDGSRISPSTIIWSTGFKADFSWIHIPEVFDATGAPIHQQGQTNIRGLFFLGLPWQSSRGSALLAGVGKDAKRIATLLATD